MPSDTAALAQLGPPRHSQSWTQSSSIQNTAQSIAPRTVLSHQMGEEEDAQAAQPRAFTSPLQQQLYLQTRLGAPVFSPKFRKPQVAGQGVRAALPQLEKSFLAQKTQQLRSSLQAAIQVPSLRQDLPGPGFPNAELPPLEHKPPGLAAVPLRGSGAKLSRAAERPPLQPGSLDSSQRVAPIKSAAQVLGPASELPYVKLIYTLREYPNTEDFVYLRRMDRNPSQYDPYALEVVPFASLQQQDFYTMSVRGITHYVDGQTLDFATLNQWERELQLFGALKQLRIFRLYKLWKGFRLWKKAVNEAKFSAAKAALQKNLFMLSPVFQKPMRQLHSLCLDLSTRRLHALQPGHCYKLQEFVGQQVEQQLVCEEQLAAFHQSSLHSVLGACRDDLMHMEERLQEFHKKHEEGEAMHMLGEAKATHQSVLIKDKDPADSDAARGWLYTIAATRRSEQRRLLAYIRMSDYMVCATLRTVLLETVRELLAAVCHQPPPHTPPPAPQASQTAPGEGEGGSGAGPQAGAEGGVAAGGASRALFELELLLDSRSGQLWCQPAGEEYQHRVGAILTSYLASLCTLTRLYGDPGLLEVVMADKAGDVEPGTELHELVANEDYDHLVSEVQSSLQLAFAATEEHKAEYYELRDMLLSDQELDVEALGPAFKAKGQGLPAQPAAPAPGEGQGGANTEEVPTAAAAEGADAEEEAEAPRVTLATFRSLMQMLAEQRSRMEALPDTVDVGIIRVNCRKLKATLVPAPTTCLARLHAMLPCLAGELFDGFMGEVQTALSRLQAPCSSVEDYVEQIQFLAQVRESERALDMRCNEIHEIYQLIDEFAIPVPAMDRAAYATMDSTYNTLKSTMEEVEGAKEDNINKYSSSLEAGIESITAEVKELRALAAHEMVLAEGSDADKVVPFLLGLQDSVDKLQEEAQRINKFQALFKLGESQAEALEDCSEEVGLKLALWQGSAEFQALTSSWRHLPFEQLDAAAMDEAISRFHKSVAKMERGLQPNKLVPAFRSQVDTFRDVQPVVQALRNRALKERHWSKVFEAIGQVLNRDVGFTLQTLLGVNVIEHKEAIQQISTEATQELALEELLAKVQARWGDVEFTVIPYKELKDVFILGAIEDIQVVLEDSMVTMSTILASRFVAGIRGEVEKVERQLSLFAETLDEWIAVQKAWMYLEPIFRQARAGLGWAGLGWAGLGWAGLGWAGLGWHLAGLIADTGRASRPDAPDIQRQLPVEAKAFASTDKQLREIMRRTKDRPNALLAGTAPGILETFQKANETLEKIQKNLEDYLETKRMGFPRFYFLSNDELLEILAQTKNVQAVQPHMGKCFDGIRRLDFGDDPRSIDIFAMISGEGEQVSLGKNLKARGNVEKWLCDVESSMIGSLRKLARLGYSSYNEEPRAQWVLHQPAQLVIVVSQIFWCAAVEAALKAADALAALTDYLQTNIKQLAELTRLVRGELTQLNRRSLAALITIDVHARDILADLIKRGTKDTNEFEWQMQLRYYLENEDVVVRQVNARFLYSYEYLGAQARLVVTPMTDRCYLTLTGALHLQLGGAPAGPAGTGKTETTKDLGKALGINCVVFNCGENLDFKFMGKFFSGLAQCGAWACFDEFNRIDIEVLSVVAQQLLTIQNALKANMSQFNFEGRFIRLVPTCGVFITMNPGYAGRTELPDNLKALFRPMAMMIPDYALVAEVMLFSEGFEDSKNLSRKMVKLYKLSSEQLSQQVWRQSLGRLQAAAWGCMGPEGGCMGLGQALSNAKAAPGQALSKGHDRSSCHTQPHGAQVWGAVLQDHYDFGMRAVKSVLVMAGSLKRANPELSEDVVLIRAMRDSNLPKFLVDDVELFQNIIRDLFPGVEVPDQDHGQLETSINKVLDARGLQRPPKYVTKVIQLYDTMDVRFGVMLVGPTGGGKTCCYRTLQGALTRLRTDLHHANQAYQQVTHTHVFNPKCIKMGELYGEYNLLTNEWTDGLASTLIRNAVADTTPDKKWVVFDGPVDAIWIENLNTVLDDNCTLCLPNGERIKLNPNTMRMLFEVQDLAVASPATVSRCGM
ncbi:hypothetical protein QJQ45_014947, partial [Haematococcus lacustris]